MISTLKRHCCSSLHPNGIFTIIRVKRDTCWTNHIWEFFIWFNTSQIDRHSISHQAKYHTVQESINQWKWSTKRLILISNLIIDLSSFDWFLFRLFLMWSINIRMTKNEIVFWRNISNDRNRSSGCYSTFFSQPFRFSRWNIFQLVFNCCYSRISFTKTGCSLTGCGENSLLCWFEAQQPVVVLHYP